MRIDVKELREHVGNRLEVPLTLQLEPVAVGGDPVRFTTPITGIGTALNTGESILVQFDLKGEVELQCARCLGRFRQPLSLQFHEEFRRGTPRDGQEGEVEAEDGALFNLYPGDEIDVRDVVRQNILLELPMKPLCRAECRGLCPHCGQDLNQGECGCQTESLDPRWAKVRRMLEEKGKGW
jgi:uncharacterized protein